MYVQNPSSSIMELSVILLYMVFIKKTQKVVERPLLHLTSAANWLPQNPYSSTIRFGKLLEEIQLPILTGGNGNLTALPLEMHRYPQLAR